jgi:alpha-1,2-mannosyltransferase
MLTAGLYDAGSDAGGGGERVLWTAVACLQREEHDVVCVVFTGDAVQVSKEDMIDKVEVRESTDVLALRRDC